MEEEAREITQLVNYLLTKHENLSSDLHRTYKNQSGRTCLQFQSWGILYDTIPGKMRTNMYSPQTGNQGRRPSSDTIKVQPDELMNFTGVAYRNMVRAYS